MRYKAVYIILLITSQLDAQVVMQQDTIKIHEVVIRGKQFSGFLPGYKSLVIEKERISNYSSSSLGYMLSAFSPLFIKDYGAGGLSTPSFRGTGASHTLVLWNGININHPMIGQSDLALISPGLMDEIRISPGSSSMSSGSGGFGGSIDLGNAPEWDEKTRIALSPGMGSYGNYAASVNAGIATASFITVTRAYLHSAENDFTFLNTYSGKEPVMEIRKNGQVNLKSFMQEIYLRKSGNVLSARLWYQTASRNLSLPVISQQIISGERQFDESLRSMIDYTFRNHGNEYFMTAAWIMNRLDYSNRLASIDTKNLTGTMIVRGGMSKQINEFTTLKINLNNEVNSVTSDNYERHVLRNNTSLTLSAQRKTGERLGTTILLREIVDHTTFLIPDFSAGLEYRFMRGENYLVYSNFSRNSRVASLNDLYWSPGGNPDLRNEYAYLYEFGCRTASDASSPVSLSTDVSLFGSFIRNMIHWHPGEFSYWTADNLKSVNASGAESFAEIKFSKNGFDLRLNAGYTYTRSVNNSIENEALRGKQLTYIPENQFNGVIQFGYRTFYSLWVTNFTGRRYTSVDNSAFLPGYALNNIVAGMKVDPGKISAEINFRIENLFNADYQSIAYYPQPGRSYFLSLKFQFDN